MVLKSISNRERKSQCNATSPDEDGWKMVKEDDSKITPKMNLDELFKSAVSCCRLGTSLSVRFLRLILDRLIQVVCVVCVFIFFKQKQSPSSRLCTRRVPGRHLQLDCCQTT